MIGGTINYAELAQQHKPKDPSALAQEVRRLSAEGLKPRDIASHLGLHIDLVLMALRGVNP